MAGTIQDILNDIITKVYGRDVRQAIHDGIEMCYNDVITPAGKQDILDHIATSDAELQNIRVGVGGQQFSSAGDAVRGQLSSLINNNAYDFLETLPKANKTDSGITFTWNANSCQVSGTATGETFCNIFASNTSLPFGMKAGEKYYIDFESDRVFLQIIQMSNSGGIVSYLYSRRGTAQQWLTIPSDISGMIVRLYINSGDIVNETVTPRIYNQFSNELLYNSGAVYHGILPLGTNLNAVETGCWLLASSYQYVNTPLPENGYGTLFAFKEGTILFQIAFGGGGNAGKMFVRNRINNNYTQWQKIDGSGGEGGNNYYFDSYESTYNVTANPSIRTDTNSYLAPTGDSTDVTASIATMLSQTGVCRLGKGDYYVRNLVMPAGTTIIGSGYQTRVILRGSEEGCAIKMSELCTVKDLQILGKTTDITVSATVENRHGILWQGTYTQDQRAPHRGIIDNVFIKNFTGGGITCYDTGYASNNCLEVTNAFIWLCNAGINIPYWSEFHKFTNVKAGNCYYGCINNGGNNVFINCDFSSNKLALLMDNAGGQSPNNSHGSCIGCVFNHSDNNTGIGIKILNCDNGFVFTGCQIFFSQINIEDSDGIVISDSNFGLNNCDITITNGGAVLFANNMHQGAPAISIINNSNVHFVNCYNRSTGAVVSN